MPRTTGVAAVLAGALILLTELIDLYGFLTDPKATPAQCIATTSFMVEQGLFLLAALLLLVSIAGLHLHQAEETRRLGLWSFMVATVGTGLLVGQFMVGFFVFPAHSQTMSDLMNADPTLLVMIGGVLITALSDLVWLLFGFAAFQARVYPSPAAVLVMVGALLAVVPLPLATVVFGAGVA